MENEIKLKPNMNILENIYSYLPIKDVSQLDSINRSHLKLSRKFNARWQTACYKHFCSEYDNYK